MKIRIKDISVKGLVLTETIEPSALGLSPTDLRYKDSFKITVSIEKVDRTILAHVEILGKYADNCARCLEEIQSNRLQEFDFDYEIKPGDEAIDLGEDLRQELILTYPTKILCTSDCKGICSSCGVNLNKEVCRCEKIV